MGVGSRSERQRILQRQTFLHAKIEIGFYMVEMLQHQRPGPCRILRLQRVEKIGKHIFYRTYGGGWS